MVDCRPGDMIACEGRFGLVILMEKEFPLKNKYTVAMLSGAERILTDEEFIDGTAKVVIKTKSIHRWDDEAVAYRKALAEMREEAQS